MRYFVIFSIISCLCNLLASAEDASSKILKILPTEDFMFNLSITLLKTCELNVEKIIIYDSVFERDRFSIINKGLLQTSVTLLSDVTSWRKINRFRIDDSNVDAIVIVTKVEDAWISMKNLFRPWRFKRDCIVYVFPVPFYDCASYKNILQLIMRFYFPAAYFICLQYSIHPVVYTHDPYGDTKPPHWTKISQDILHESNWTFYARSYKKDVSELCVGFYFKRTDPTNKTSLNIGLHSEQVDLTSIEIKEKIYDYKIEKYLERVHEEQACDLKRLLKLQFKYFIVESPRREYMLRDAYENTAIDACIFTRATLNENPSWNFFYPVRYEKYAIISHNRGLMTPLEKIAKFYGIWTLSSLVILMITTFIVIWLVTKNVSLAAFDVIRLLINTGIIVPINTRSRKLYFIVIFLYFLIIHATFSGHLAEFLTSIDYRKNIDTIEDLKNPRIEIIYRFGYKFDDNKEFDVLQQKTEHITRSSQCQKIFNRLNSACIASLSATMWLQADLNEDNKTLYTSKSKFGFSVSSNVYRPGLPVHEKFNWAITYLFDTSIINHVVAEIERNQSRIIRKQIAAIHVKYRGIKISDIYFALVLLIIGYCAAFVGFLLEIAFEMITNKLKNRRANGNIVSILVEPYRSL